MFHTTFRRDYDDDDVGNEPATNPSTGTSSGAGDHFNQRYSFALVGGARLLHGVTAPALRSWHVSVQIDAGVPIEDLGFAIEDGVRMRRSVSNWVDIWDDPDMDVYNAVLTR